MITFSNVVYYYVGEALFEQLANCRMGTKRLLKNMCHVTKPYASLLFLYAFNLQSHLYTLHLFRLTKFINT